MKKTLILAGMLLMSGCALLTPYESSFSCPESYNGKCVSVQTAYSESSGLSVKAKDVVADQPHENCGPDTENPGACAESGKESAGANSSSKENGALTKYRAALFDKFTGLLKEPVTPVVAPPKTMRVLLLPYTEEAKAFAQGLNLTLIDGRRLRQMIDVASKTIAESAPSPAPTPAPSQPAATSPVCPKCSSEMKKRVARQGVNAGKDFWGCVSYPKCNGIRPI